MRLEITNFNSMTKRQQKKKFDSFYIGIMFFFAGKNHGIILNRYSYIFIFNFQSVYRTSDIY